VDIHFNSYKVRYELLNIFLRPIQTTHSIRSVNIFVDIDDLFHMLHMPLINNEFQVCGTNAGKQLASNIFNLLGHYRNWAIKNRLKVKVYGIYTTTLRSFKNSIYVTDYRKKFKDTNDPQNASYFFINEAIKMCAPLLPLISNYIPDVYLIDSKYLEPCIIPYFISQDIFKMDWNILISRDTYNLQYSYKDKWSLISPKGENSNLIRKTDLWNYLNIRERIYKDPVDLKYNHNLYIFAKSIVGDKFRSVPRLRKIGWITIFKYLDEIIEKYGDSSYTTMQVQLLELLKGQKKITDEDINNNLSVISIENQIETLNEIDRSSILNQIKDIPDYENLKYLNTTQFMKFPINLQFLCNELVEYKKKSPFD
jgi:hypothetical protein